MQEEEGTVRISRAAPTVAPAAIQYAAAPVAPVGAPAAAPDGWKLKCQDPSAFTNGRYILS